MEKRSANPAALVALPILILSYTNIGSFAQTTPASLVYNAAGKVPIESVRFQSGEASGEVAPIGWISLARTILPDARSLTPEERSSINEFFWSHFE